MTKYNILVDFVVEASTEEQAQQNLTKFIRMSMLDHGLTFGVKDSDLVEFVIGESSNVRL